MHGETIRSLLSDEVRVLESKSNLKSEAAKVSTRVAFRYEYDLHTDNKEPHNFLILSQQISKEKLRSSLSFSFRAGIS